MQRRTLLLGGAAAAVVAGALGWELTRPNFAGRAITPDEARVAVANGEVTLVDIRRPDEWMSTGIAEGAVAIDMRRDDFTDALLEVVGETGAPVAIICARGVRSARLSNRLVEAGFTNIIDVPEGMLGSGAGPGWIERGLPVREARVTDIALE